METINDNLDIQFEEEILEESDEAMFLSMARQLTDLMNRLCDDVEKLTADVKKLALQNESQQNIIDAVNKFSYKSANDAAQRFELIEARIKDLEKPSLSIKNGYEDVDEFEMWRRSRAKEIQWKNAN